MNRNGFEWLRQCENCQFEHPFEGICVSDMPRSIIRCTHYKFDGLMRERDWKYWNELSYLNLNMGSNYVLNVSGVV